jgi:hypothetical protein
MDGFICGALFAVSRKCSRLAEQLAELHAALPKDDRADPARALARRQQLRMQNEADEARRLAQAILEIATARDASPLIRRREISRYRRCVAAGRFAEYFVVPFLRGFDDTAMELTDLCRRITTAVDWPHSGWPLVARGATNYFHFIADEEDELILAPALAGSTVLPLPDLVHEMAHALVRNGERRQTLLAEWCSDDYVVVRVVEALGESKFARMAARHWVEHGVEEIACDAIAAWVTGPAYAWQHIRACWGREEGKSVYDDSDYHPPDHARFEVIELALSRVGGQDELDEIREAWNRIIGDDESLGDQGGDAAPLPTPYPSELVLEFVDEVLQGCVRVGIRPFADALAADDPCRIFSDGWREMRSEPAAFDRKERQREA